MNPTPRPRLSLLGPPDGWIRTIIRVFRELGEDNLTVVAAGVAFYFLLAVVPLLAAMVSIYGLVADPELVHETVVSTASVLPAEGRAVLESQLLRISAGTEESLSLGVMSGIALSLWSAAYGTNALMAGLNVAYDTRETRHIIVRYLVSFALLAVGMVPAFMAITALGVLPAMFTAVVDVLTWPILALAFWAYLLVFYRFGPSRPRTRTAWVMPGAFLATGLWVAVSIGFSNYVSTFDTYTEMYGSLAGVVVLLVWLWLTALMILVGAELNAELERQTSEAAVA
ncbi:MAG: YihY/virulence factor BrkB family protein [Myxococcota bacterium]